MAHTPADDPLSFIGRGLLESLDSGGGQQQQQQQQQQPAPTSSQQPLFQSTSASGAASTPPSALTSPSAGPHPSYGRLPSQGLHTHRVFGQRQPYGAAAGGREGVFGPGAPRADAMGAGPSDVVDRVSHPPGLALGRGGQANDAASQQFLGRIPLDGSFGQQQQDRAFQPYSYPASSSQPMSQYGGQPFEAHSPTAPSAPGSHPGGDQDGSRYASNGYYPPSQHALPPDPLYSQHPYHHQPSPSAFVQSPLSPSFPMHGSAGHRPMPLPPMQYGHQLPPPLRPQQQQSSQGTPNLSLSMLPVGMGGVNPLLGQNGRFPRHGGGGRNGGEGGSGNGLGRADAEEEISTIFVVGFPDDMQEREFQNMFTFCKDFEAATLKLPPPQSSVIPTSTQQQPGMQNPAAAATAAAVAQAALSALAGTGKPDQALLLNNPYLDTVALGYDLQDANGGPQSSLGLGGFLSTNASTAAQAAAASAASSTGPPRRQSIGFAKFKTRQAALDARDALQGRKVDVERASVLKAEMAKKNLHTRRGVGGDESVSSLNVGGSVGGVSVVGGGVAMGGVSSPNGGLAPAPFRHARAGDLSPLVAGSSEGANVDQSTPVIAPPVSRPLASSSDEYVERDSPPTLSNSSLSSSPPSHLQSPNPDSPHDGVYPPSSASGAHTSISLHKDTAGDYPLSPESFGLAQSLTAPTLDLRPQDDLAEFSPPLSPDGLGGKEDATLTQAHYRSPSLSRLQSRPVDETRDSDRSSASGSASSSFGKSGGDRLKQMPRTANPADMNPPINTLYVGNLPSTPSPSSSSSSQLEDALRTLFSRCEGFRRLSYRQKTNGPMCFVEFDDVDAASSVLKTMYGNTVGGLVKGGIRLSYSKHPLGQRGPSSAPINGGQAASSWSNSSSIGSPPMSSQSIGSPVDYSFAVDFSDSSNQGSIGSRHHARAPVPFATSFAQASSAAGQHRSFPMPSQPSSSQTRNQVQHSSPPGVQGYSPIIGSQSSDPFPSLKSHAATGLPPSLSRSPPTTVRLGLSPTNAAWSAPTFSPFGHDFGSS